LFLLKYIIYISKQKGEKKRRLDLEILIAAEKKQKKNKKIYFFLAEYMLEKTLIIGKLVSRGS
jgi:hypothetical protein